jgi:hypothetical protein
VHTAAAQVIAVGELVAAPAEVEVTPTNADPGRASGDSHAGTTGAQVDTARQLLHQHRRVCVPEPVCNWCLTTWPCPEIVRAWYTLPDED